MREPIKKSGLKHYPLKFVLKGQSFTLRPMTPDDGPLLLSFARELPHHDTLYLQRDITQQHGIDSWMDDLRAQNVHALLASDADGVVGYTAVNLNKLEWTRHVADLRVSTAVRVRGFGLGRLLVREGFNIALALNVEKLLALMTPDQKGARALFLELGFQPEALLKDHVKDRDGNYHDLLIQGCNVQNFLAQRAAYGVEA
jgi:L-amino acid N-acyltransferase YncA